MKVVCARDDGERRRLRNPGRQHYGLALQRRLEEGEGKKYGGPPLFTTSATLPLYYSLGAIFGVKIVGSVKHGNGSTSSDQSHLISPQWENTVGLSLAVRSRFRLGPGHRLPLSSRPLRVSWAWPLSPIARAKLSRCRDSESDRDRVQ